MGESPSPDHMALCLTYVTADCAAVKVNLVGNQYWIFASYI